MKAIGYVGLGTMGLPMAINLVRKSGLSVSGYDIAPARMALLAKEGGKAIFSLDTLLAENDVIFMCLTTNDLLRQTVERALAVAKPGTVLVDMGSSAPDVVRALYAQAKDKGMALLDCPVSGGEVGSVAGTLALMCGGDKEVFEKILPLFRCMGSSVTYMGASGNGSVAKLANNMIVAIHLAALGEAYGYAVKAGLDPNSLFAAIKDGLAQSAVQTLKVPKIISRDFSPSARSAVLEKDLVHAVKLADKMGVKIPMTQMILDWYQELAADGRTNEDHSAIVRVFERDMGVEIK